LFTRSRCGGRQGPSRLVRSQVGNGREDWPMNPERHYKRAFRFGWLALLAPPIFLACAGFHRNSGGQFHLGPWARWPRPPGMPLRPGDGTILPLFSACCPRCGGAAYWRSLKTIAYVCRGCGYRHDTGIDWGEGEMGPSQGAAPNRALMELVSVSG